MHAAEQLTGTTGGGGEGLGAHRLQAAELTGSGAGTEVQLVHAGSSCVALRPDGDPVGTAGGVAQSCKLRAHALQLLDCRCILERILSLAACQPYCVINARWRRGSWFATHSFLNQRSWTRASAWHVRTHATQCQHPKCRCKTIVQRRLADTGAIGFVNSSWPQFDVSHSWQCCIKPGMC